MRAVTVCTGGSAGLELVLAQDTFLQMVARLVDASKQIGEDSSRQLGDNI